MISNVAVSDTSVPGRRCELVGLSILVVDDERESREMLALYLERHGATTSSVCCVEDALAAIIQAPPDLVISDIAMPGEDGYSLLRKIRSLPQCADMPVIALSGFAGPADFQRSLEAGFEKHVAKPVKLKELLLSLANVVAK